MAKIEADFRQRFGQMAPQAIISRSELANLLCITEGAISQMTYRDELPDFAFPEKRRACWFVADIREWLDERRQQNKTPKNGPENSTHQLSKPRKIGRPRRSVTIENRS